MYTTLAFTLPPFLAGPAGAVLAALVLAALAKGLHFALRKGADAAEVKFPDHKDEIEKAEQEAEKIVDDISAAAKAPLSAAAKEVLSTGTLSPQGQSDLKAAAEQVVKDEKAKL
jgi:hypothetical protein